MIATTRDQRRTSDKHRTAVGTRRKAVERAALDLICDVIDTDLPTDAILARFGRAVQAHLPADVIQRHRERRARRAAA